MQTQQSKNRATKTRSKEKKGRVIPGLPYPSEIIDFAKQANLSPHERHLLHCLRAAMHRKNLTCWKRQDTLAREMGASRSTVSRAIKGLKEKGIITIGKMEKKVGFDNNIYSINYPWRRSIGGTQTCVAREDKHTYQVDTRICTPEEHIPVSEGNSNKSRVNALNRISPHQQGKEQEDDSIFPISKKKEKAEESTDLKTTITDQNCRENVENDFVAPAGTPPAAS